MGRAIEFGEMAVQAVFPAEHFVAFQAGSVFHRILTPLDSITADQNASVPKVLGVESLSRVCTCAILDGVLRSIPAVAADHVFVPAVLPVELPATLGTGNDLFGDFFAWLNTATIVQVSPGLFREGFATFRTNEIGWCGLDSTATRLSTHTDMPIAGRFVLELPLPLRARQPVCV